MLGVVRPSAEALAGLPPGAIPGVTPPALVTGDVAVLATPGTVASDSYRIELGKLAPGLRLVQQACPLWVPLVEAGETSGPGRRTFSCAATWTRCSSARSRRRGCCLAVPTTRCCCRASAPSCRRGTEVLAQGDIVAERLADWLRPPPRDGRPAWVRGAAGGT